MVDLSAIWECYKFLVLFLLKRLPEIVERRLDEFNVSLEKHVVACVTDGAAVMVKFGKSIPCEHQLCYAHGIHLAVCDVLYGKNATVIAATESEEIRDEDDSPYLRQDEDLENEDFSTAVDFGK